MLLRTLMRSSAATYVVPALVIFILVALNQDLTTWTTPRYWPSAMASSIYALPFVVTISAGLGAWEGARLTRGKVFQQTNLRSPLHITGMVLAPVVLGAFLTCMAALVVSAGAAGVSWALPDWRILVTEFLLILANTLTGYSIGRRFSAVISVPVCLVGAFVASAYPQSWSILWTRHLVGGGLTGCCATDEVLDARAVWSAIAFAAGIIIACALVIDRHASRAALAGGAALLVVGSVTGAALARPLSASPVQARPDSALQCAHTGGTTVCLWPEVSHPAIVRSRSSRDHPCSAVGGRNRPNNSDHVRPPSP